MWTFIVFVIFLILILSTFIRVMIYGKGIFKPDFKRVDLEFGRKKKISTNWNTPFGKGVYYIFLIIMLLSLFLIFYRL